MKPAGRVRKVKTVDKVETAIQQSIPDAVQRPDTHFNKNTKDNDLPSRAKKVDELTRTLGCEQDGYYHKMIWPWLKYNHYGVKYRLSVDRFYQSRNIAIDINLDESGKAFIDLKKKLCHENGITYFHLTDMDSVQKMINHLETH